MRRNDPTVRWRRTYGRLTAGAAALLVAACVTSPGCTGDEPPSARITHFVDEDCLAGVGRVVLVGFVPEDTPPDIAAETTQALAQAVSERRLFNVEVVERDGLDCPPALVGPRETLRLSDLRDIRRRFGCDAILLGCVSNFRPHPRTRMGLTLRMIDVRRGELVWAVDHRWDTTDRRTERRIRDFFGERMRSGYEPMDWRLVMISPKAFEKFVAWETAATLPDVESGVSRQHAGRTSVETEKIP